MKRMRVEGYEVEIVRRGDEHVAYVPKLPGCAVLCKEKEREHLPFLVARAIANYLISIVISKQEMEMLPPGMRGGKLNLEPPPEPQ